ncbi:hypothetical protein BV898_13861 [Hypsibius exemplaris]|uniref:Uncharacterized protein n=1 Tax=Hypsibius exemplaris TaxID=2072580 RepID=A0A1W0W9K0_HYPEX|nr:hypothetical protein BV898_13861 [Hypsibius exemplaris]
MAVDHESLLLHRCQLQPTGSCHRYTNPKSVRFYAPVHETASTASLFPLMFGSRLFPHAVSAPSIPTPVRKPPKRQSAVTKFPFVHRPWTSVAMRRVGAGTLSVRRSQTTTGPRAEIRSRFSGHSRRWKFRPSGSSPVGADGDLEALAT